jgi:sugar phosphate permease
MLLNSPALVSQTARKSACRILTAWFPTRERGTWWGFWTASNNIGGFAAPLIAGGAANRFGWRWVHARTPWQSSLSMQFSHRRQD